MDVVAAFFALAAGILFGLASHIQKIALSHAPARAGTLVTVWTMAILFLMMSPFFIDWSWWLTEPALYFIVCGLLFPGLAQRFQIASVARVGPSLTAAMGAFAPLFAVLPAVMFLGETMNIRITAGLGMLICGLFLAAIKPKGLQRDWKTVALAIPLGAAFVRGIIQPLSKAGLEQLPSPFFATLAMTMMSALVITVMTLGSGKIRGVTPSFRGFGWFALNGFLIGIGILALLVAINIGDVLISASLAATTPLWTVLLGFLFFRSETLGWRHLFISAMVFAGAVLIVNR